VPEHFPYSHPELRGAMAAGEYATLCTPRQASHLELMEILAQTDVAATPTIANRFPTPT